MDYKKLYEEALERAKKIYNEHKAQPFNAMTKVFPELKESEDERIRKDILVFIRHEGQHIDKYEWHKWIAWLEKQGKHTNTRININENITMLNACVNVLKNVGHQHLASWLEKQGEQKPADKPKFKVGDWIIHYGTKNIYKVVAIIDNQYQLKYGDNYTVQNCADVDRCARLWDIAKDAKDGDILQLGKVTAIFQKYIGNGNCKCYCSLCNGEFEIPSQDGDDNSYGCYDAIPATKEQRDTLLKAMVDAGYKWDRIFHII